MDSSSSRSQSHLYSDVFTTHNRGRHLWKKIRLAILDKSCAICLRYIDDRRAAVIVVCMHAYCIECIRRWSNLKRKCPLCNFEFDSWFCRIEPSSRTFHRERLRPLVEEARRVNHVDMVRRRTRRFRFTERRTITRAREEQDIASRPSAPLPRRRSFGQIGRLPCSVVTERVLQWRASIYDRHLQAVPCPSRICLEQDVAGKKGAKERILQRIEPWVHRELKAILRDPDPSLIVHVVTSLFISSLEGKRCMASSEQSGVADNYLDPLQRFLFEKSYTFWHELRCFAESSFNMETYDMVVEYV